VSYRTALTWFLAGTLPVFARPLPTGTIVVESSAGPGGETVAYCRVSSAEQGDEVERQAGRVAEEAGGRGITLDAAVTVVGSGVTGNRVTLRKVLADPQVSGIVVEHRDRRARFGVEHREAARAATGRRIIVVNPGWGDRRPGAGHDPRSRASMCARRSARRRAEAGVRCATADVVTEVVAR
jgi:putative resolvase